MIPLRRTISAVCWRRENLAGLLLLSLLAGGTLSRRAMTTEPFTGAQPPLRTDRVAAVFDRIDPNTAPIASLVRLPGIGPSRAQAILDYRRTRTRRFACPADLTRVRGIGPATVATMTPYLAFAPRGR